MQKASDNVCASGSSSSAKSHGQQPHHHPNTNINLNTAPTNISSQDPTSGTLSMSTTMTDGGYDYELLGGTELLDARYECPICLLYLRDPVLTHCGHKFCFYCISQWIIKEGGRCPVDGALLSHDSIFPDNFTRREILQCKAKCPFVKEGCTVILSLPELEKHIHVEHNSPGKLNTSNPSSPCNEMVSCMYKDVGCFTFVSRDQLQKHLETEVHHHLQLITAAYKRLKSSRILMDYPPREYFLRQDSRESTKCLLADETIDSDDYQFRRQWSWDSVRFARKQYVGPKYSDKLAESDESLGKSDSHTNSPHSSQNHNLNKVGCELVSASSEGLSSLNGSNGIELKNVYERLVRLEQTDREKQIKINHLESQLSSALNLWSTLTQVMDDITARYCHGVFVWKISGFKKLCSEMRRNPNRVLNSPGFYTDTFGYKLCLRFNLTTATATDAASAAATVSSNITETSLEQDTNTFVSLYIHFMKGEYDDTLRWPFHGEFKLIIVHPASPEISISEVMRSKPDAAAFAKPTLARNIKGFGYAEFCPLNKIFTGGFVKDNTITCKILAKAH